MSNKSDPALPADPRVEADGLVDDREREEFAAEEQEAAGQLGVHEPSARRADAPSRPPRNRAKLAEPTVGEAVLRLRAAEDHQVGYSLVEASGMTKGSLIGDANLMQAAFKAGRGRLVIDEGRKIEVTFVALTAGANTIYFEAAARSQVQPKTTKAPGRSLKVAEAGQQASE